MKQRTKKTTAKKSSLFEVSGRNVVSHGKNVETMHAVSFLVLILIHKKKKGGLQSILGTNRCF